MYFGSFSPSRARSIGVLPIGSKSARPLDAPRLDLPRLAPVVRPGPSLVRAPLRDERDPLDAERDARDELPADLPEEERLLDEPALRPLPLRLMVELALRPDEEPRDDDPALRDDVPREEPALRDEVPREEPALRDDVLREELPAPREDDVPRVEPALRDAEPRFELALRAEPLRAEPLRVLALRPEPERVLPPALRDELVVREPVLREPP